MVVGEIRCEIAAHRAAHVDGALELQGVRDRHDRIHEVLRVHPVLCGPPAVRGRRERSPVERQVVGDHPEPLLKLAVFQEVSPLPAVGAGRVLQHHRHALTGFLEVHPVLDAADPDVDVASDRRVELAVDLVAQVLRNRGPQRLANERREPQNGGLVRPAVIGVVSGGPETVVAEALAPGVQRPGDPDVEVRAGTCRNDLDHPSVADRDTVVVVIESELHERIPLASGEPELRVGIDEGGEGLRIEPLQLGLRGGGRACLDPCRRGPLRERHRQSDGSAAGAQHERPAIHTHPTAPLFTASRRPATARPEGAS